MSHKTGAATGTVMRSASRRRQDERRKQRQERYWASRSGPVTTRRVDPRTLRSG